MQETYFLTALYIFKNLIFQQIYFIINTLRVTNPLFIQLIEHYQKTNS